MKSIIKKYFLPILPWAILAYLLSFTYALFFTIPYLDFHFESDHIVVALYVEESDSEIKIGDKVIDINGINLELNRDNLLSYKYENIKFGGPIYITVDRDGELIIFEQSSKISGKLEFFARLTTQWWFSYVFWFAGLITFLNIRPRNLIWKVLTSFFFLISIWMMASSGLSNLNFSGSAIILRVGIILTFPTIVHLHYIYPSPLGEKTTPVWIRILYLVSVILILLQTFQLISPNLYILTFLLSLVISILLIIYRFLNFKDQRKAFRVIGIFTFFAVLPGIFVSISHFYSIILPYPLGGLTASSFPLIPLAYLYSINRQKFGKLEFRVNKLISIYLYLVLLGSVLIVLLPFLSNLYSINDNGTAFAIISSIIFSIISIFTFLPFQKIIENRVLGIPFNLEELKKNFTTQLSTTFDHDKYNDLIVEKVSASLLIKQSILYEIENKFLSIIYAQGIDTNLVLEFDNITDINNLFSKLISEEDNIQLPDSIKWAKLILPINFENQLIGLWIFGKRDPDDFYNAYDIEILQTLADQLAVSITNHQQSQHLRSLYQQNIDRHETERARLARELHDETLNNLALIKQQSIDPEIIKATETTISDLRKIIQGLRPEMLTYGGLATALEDLADLLNERQHQVKIITDIYSEPSETDEKIELHIFRIVQQSCENALQHAKAKNIFISGTIKPNFIEIEIVDDGIGFSGSSLDFRKLLSERHYGLAGIYERATLIKSNIRINSVLGTGTNIKISWKN